MRFWDTSAIVPLIVEQPISARCRALRRSDPAIAVWALSRVEAASALHRLVRDGVMERGAVTVALKRADAMFARFVEIIALDSVRERAERVLAVHALTAADALQLGAALALVSDRPRRRGFVTADERLAQAAEAEGFDAIVPG